MKKYDVVALGELLIDFTDNGISDQGNPLMEANPGGAPCNVLALLSKLSHKTAFIGKVGNDIFGKQLTEAIENAGICSQGLVKDDEVHTTLAFVHTFPGGDRDFSFYRNPGADMMLTKDEIDTNLINETRIFHFGSLSMTSEGCFEATKFAIDAAKKAGAIVSFDPNLREPLWSSLDAAKEKIAFGIGQCDILKISDNEILWFTGLADYDEAVSKLRADYPNVKLLMLSLGRDGSRAFSGNESATVMPFLQENTIETTGAGDTFCGSVLHYVLEHGFGACDAATKFLGSLTEAELTEMLTFANAAASIITTRKGALSVMPEKAEILELISQYFYG